jgi:hypothetical protein
MEPWTGVRRRLMGEGGLPAHWRRRLERAAGAQLAVLRDPALHDILHGKKWVEVRITRVRCAPYGRVRERDVVLLKRTGGGLEGVATVQEVESFPRDVLSMAAIQRRCRDGAGHGRWYADFWRERSSEDYQWVTLVHLTDVWRLATPVEVVKTDAAAWIVMGEMPG